MSLDALPEPLLTARGLARHYGVRLPGGLMGRRATLKAVDGIDFELARGEILGLVGESGCGKSTTAKLVLGHVAPSAGVGVTVGSGTGNKVGDGDG